MTKHIICLTGLAILAIYLVPSVTYADTLFGSEYAGITSKLLNPDTLFKTLKENITIPLPTVDKKIEVPTPEKALKDASPKLQEVNRDVKEETGIDLAKFIGWFAKILKLFFQVIVDLLEQVASAMKPKVSE